MTDCPERALILSRLKDLGIEARVFEHQAIFTVAEGALLAKEHGYRCCKSLLLRNKKDEFFLVVMPAEKRLSSGEIARQAGSGHLSFANDGELARVLRTFPGAVSPLALLFDTESRVRVLLDREIEGFGFIGCHPCTNEASVRIAPGDLIGRYIPSTGHKPEFVTVGGN